MRHRSICPRCGRLDYLYPKELSEDNAFVPSVVYLCKECLKPLHVIFLTIDDWREENAEKI